jgi:hypothetical protein
VSGRDRFVPAGVPLGRRVRQRAAVLALCLLIAPLARAHAGGLSGIFDLRYQVGSGDAAVDNALAVGLQARLLPGRRLTACFGADAAFGLGGGGAVYDAALYPLGLGLRYGRTSHVALCAGAGMSGVTDGAIPSAWTFPVELRWEATGAFGVVRPLLVARAARVAGADAREDGSPLLSAVDELHLAAGVRFVIPGQPLPGLFTGDGVYLGLTYDEALGDRILGFAIGYAFAAGD